MPDSERNIVHLSGGPPVIEFDPTEIFDPSDQFRQVYYTEDGMINFPDADRAFVIMASVADAAAAIGTITAAWGRKETFWVEYETAGGEKQECQLVAIQPLAEQVGEETKIKLIVRMQPPVGDEDYQEAF
ncbi:hypothetical protein A2Z33_02070 [Candidatus Gottesmanbacteria bacterium RBG_16_52_11]|uniref:Uncharacterized protein n=1 Tax=Candidatus Gottesmanbacteria bacterium RBG_16_52_11 TaxID=1798374 RepID=A0A1F5YR06_9BACT|nr:MAG: hypothetical protein A2Z33_02070 [Candidatus Gottesmanbacteria bacterium RBG_16_52_11]